MSRPVRGLTLAAGLLAAQAPADLGSASAAPGSAATLCRPSEVVLFACGVGAKRVSVCGQGQGTAVYRFGRPGRVELQVRDLYFAERAFSGGGETQVYADTPTHRYIVYDRVVRTSFDDGRHDPQAESGLVVQRGTRTLSSRRCASPATFDERTRTMVPAGRYSPH